MKRGRLAGAANFTTDNLHTLNMFCMKYKPIAGDEWEFVANDYNKATGQNRSAEALKKKFRELRDKKIPTGDPDCPDHVRDAKRTHRMTNERVMLDTSMPDPEIKVVEQKPEPEANIYDDLSLGFELNIFYIIRKIKEETNGKFLITGINTDAVMFLWDQEINLSVCNDNLQSILKQPIKMNKKEH